MVSLPKNQPKEKDITPKMFFIWGQSMSGKTFLSRQFPNPIIVNTDGNAKKVSTPSVEVFDFESFVQILGEIEKGKHTYETIIIDLVDDIKTMLEVYVCKKYDIEALADAPYGKAFSDVKTTWKTLMVRLSQLPYNTVFISHIIEKSDDANPQRMIEEPSLELKFYNMTMGRCDLSIKCRKLGSTYHQMVVNRRDTYHVEDITDDRIVKALATVKGVFDAPLTPALVDKKPVVTKKTITPLKKVATITVAPEPENMSPKEIMQNEPVGEITEPTPLMVKAKKQLKPLKTK